MAEKKLEVKNLTISFKTANGKVQAVRDISFDLYKGETLSIVGESGSGKSVTSRAIMGILAGNAIVEGGKILYSGKDLLKTPEEEFNHIRGDKIAMVFQDPLSSLNPIMRVGQQLTEAMLLKNKASRRESRKHLNGMLAALEKRMNAMGNASAKEKLAMFKKFGIKHSQLQIDYAESLEACEDALSLCEDILLHIEKKSYDRLKESLDELRPFVKRSKSYFVVRDREAELDEVMSRLMSDFAEDKKNAPADKDSVAYQLTAKNVSAVTDILREAAAFEKPNTYTLGYYLTFVNAEIPNVSVAELNELTHKATAEGFMDDFIKDMTGAVKASMDDTDENRKAALAELKEALSVFRNSDSKAECDALAKSLKATVLKCIDPLEVEVDSLTHTFNTSIDYAMNLYFGGTVKNVKEEARYTKMQAKYDALVAKGKTPDWDVIPASYIDLDAAREGMVDTIQEMITHYESQLAANADADLSEKALEIIDYLKEMAQQSVDRLTKASAREKAIKLMDSVGIDEPRRRFSQYPFEFSGGMRQRIVIAIALTANPDVLICDEPTTALDVTIQAQILELINKLKEERQLSVIFITHDLGVVANMADRIAVMYAGKIVEYGTAADVFYSPAHPYTWALLSSVPDLDTTEKLESVPGTPPNMIYPPKGDAFAERNKYALEIDFEMQPPMFQISDSHYAATWLLHPDAPKIDPPAIVTERIARMKEKRGEA